MPNKSPEPTAVGAGQFRCRGSRRESAVAQLFSLGIFTFMGIDLRWEDERGEQLAVLPDAGFVEQFLPAEGAQDFPCLRFVDPYGDTVFNQPQITQLVLELERLSATEA